MALRILALLLWCLGAAETAATAADLIKVKDSRECGLLLRGKIIPADAARNIEGDAASLRKALADDPAVRSICLDSEGGNLLEALDIGELLLDKAISTRIGPAQKCLSACSLIFMSGTRSSRGYRFISRSMASTASLGFHTPQPPRGDVDGEGAFDAVVDQVGRRLLRLANQQPYYWKHPLIKARLINFMLLTTSPDPRKYYYINSIGRAAEFEVDIATADEIGTLTTPDVKSDFASRIRSICYNVIANQPNADMTDNTFRTTIKSIEKTRNERESTDVYTLQFGRKLSSCKVSVQDVGRVNAAIFFGGPPTMQAADVRAWYAASPADSLTINSSPLKAALAQDGWCTATDASFRKTVCDHSDLSRYELEWQGLKRTKVGWDYYE